ncbi:hypothetical protein MKW92_039959 [Papaver armeniacum]|nr:hypothetical protein MKW92_039959 [Papaver armeniacum]
MAKTIVDKNHHRKGEETQGGEEAEGKLRKDKEETMEELGLEFIRDEDDDDEANEEDGGGLRKSEELKKLLGHSVGMNDSDFLAVLTDYHGLREATAVVEVGCNFKDVRWCIRNKHLFFINCGFYFCLIYMSFELKFSLVQAEGFMKDPKDIEETMTELSLAFIRFTDNTTMVIVYEYKRIKVISVVDIY